MTNLSSVLSTSNLKSIWSSGVEKLKSAKEFSQANLTVFCKFLDRNVTWARETYPLASKAGAVGLAGLLLLGAAYAVYKFTCSKNVPPKAEPTAKKAEDIAKKKLDEANPDAASGAGASGSSSASSSALPLPVPSPLPPTPSPRALLFSENDALSSTVRTLKGKLQEATVTTQSMFEHNVRLQSEVTELRSLVGTAVAEFEARKAKAQEKLTVLTEICERNTKCKQELAVAYNGIDWKKEFVVGADGGKAKLEELKAKQNKDAKDNLCIAYYTSVVELVEMGCLTSKKNIADLQEQVKSADEAIKKLTPVKA